MDPDLPGQDYYLSVKILHKNVSLIKLKCSTNFNKIEINITYQVGTRNIPMEYIEIEFLQALLRYKKKLLTFQNVFITFFTLAIELI